MSITNYLVVFSQLLSFSEFDDGQISHSLPLVGSAVASIYQKWSQEGWQGHEQPVRSMLRSEETSWLYWRSDGWRSQWQQGVRMHSALQVFPFRHGDCVAYLQVTCAGLSHLNSSTNLRVLRALHSDAQSHKAKYSYLISDRCIVVSYLRPWATVRVCVNKCIYREKEQDVGETQWIGTLPKSPRCYILSVDQHSFKVN